mgnify:CR=1 FL=1
MTDENTLLNSDLESRYEKYKGIIKNFTLMSDIFMRNVFKKRECLEYVLQVIMEKQDLYVIDQVIQKDYKNLQGRSAVMDCVARDSTGKQFDVEIQQDNEGASPKRARYHSGLMDMNTLNPGQDFEELPESYVLGSDPEVYAVYTVHGGEKQESTSVRVDAEISGLPELLENSTGQELEAAKAVKPQSHAFWLLGISLGSTAAAALVTFLVVRFITWRKKRRRTRTEQGQTRRGK